jgi:predicted phosphodiesterase
MSAALVLSGLAAFFLLPVPAGAEILRVAVISDLNGSYGSTRYEASVDAAVVRIRELEPDLVLSTGDMVAGQRKPHLTQGEVERMWSAFHRRVSDPLAAAGIPLAVTPGNHDGSAYRGFELERRIYAEQWRQKRPAVRFIDDTHYPFHYAFAAGDVLFVSLDATTVGRLPEAQMAWLRDLLTEHGDRYDHRVAFSHVPLWPVAQRRERDFIGDPALERLLQGSDVDLYLSGHHHAFYPGHKDGIHYVSQSCLGAGPRRLIGTSDRSPRSLTLLEFDGKHLRLAALQAPRFMRPIDWDTLPRRIRSDAADLTRADLAGDRLEQLRIGSHPGRAAPVPGRDPP